MKSQVECFTGVSVGFEETQGDSLKRSPLSEKSSYGHLHFTLYPSLNLLVFCFGVATLDLSRIPAQPKSDLVNLLIEIPAGSKNKYEFDKDLNAFALDRVLYSSVQYPCDYGFIPNTLADDGDPLDGMVLIDQPTFPGCVIAARPIGMLEMIDDGDRDEKLLCVPDKDPRYSQVKSLQDVAPHRLDEIAEFFGTYKKLEKKVTEILGWKGIDQVMPLIEKCVKAGAH